jgi:hypothetical protein
LGHAVRRSRFVLARFVLARSCLAPGRFAAGGRSAVIRGAYPPGTFVRPVEHGSVESRYAPGQPSAEQRAAEQPSAEPGDIAQPEQFVAWRRAPADVVPRGLVAGRRADLIPATVFRCPVFPRPIRTFLAPHQPHQPRSPTAVRASQQARCGKGAALWE